MEHLATFGLTRDPFSSNPELGVTFKSQGFQDATRRLERAALQGKGLCLVTGRGGVGKTMLVRHLLESLEEEAFEACMLVPVPGITDTRWILTRLAMQLGVEEPETESSRLLGQVYEQLAIVREDGRTPVLILDEAQVLADQGLLADLRGLLNLEYEERRLLSIILVGLPELGRAVARDPALADRVDLRVSLQPLTEEESGQYVAHRIRVADGNPAILESAAVACLTKWGEGVPRRLNTLADNALFEAHLAGRVSATPEDVDRAAAELLQDSVPEDGSDAVAAPPRMAASPVAAPPVQAALTAAASSQSVDLFEAPELVMDDVVADATDPGFPSAGAEDFNGRGPDQTVFMASPPPGVAQPAADATVAVMPEATPAAPAETVALLTDMPDASGEGDLDDLFADLVDD
jgi:type II secretory pathway predicted ATPase ExeA